MTTQVDRSASLVLEPVLDSAAAARHFVRDRLVEWDADELIDDTLLAISELVTNAILHARSTIEVRLDLGEDRLRVEVQDRSARPVLLDSVVAGVVDEPLGAGVDGRPEIPSLDDETSTGRGLFIVASVASALGEHLDHAGKTVWFELDRKPSGMAGKMVVQAGRVHPEAPVVAIRLVGLVPSVVIAADEHLDDLLRELPLVRGDGESEAQAFVDCAREVASTHPDLERIADAARIASSRGRGSFDVTIELSMAAAEQIATLHDLAARAQRLCREGIVLTLPAPDRVLDFWNWLTHEVQRQLVQAEGPTPFPG